MKIRRYMDCIEDQKVWDILRVFIDGVQFITGRQMSYLLGLNHKTCTRYLEKLYQYSILDKHIAGRAYIYTLKDNYFTNKVLVPLLTREKMLLINLKNELVEKFSKECHSIVVCGAYAEKKEVHDSAFEVCFFIEDRNPGLINTIDDFKKKIQNEFELEFDYVIIDLNELEKREDLALIQHIKTDGEWLFGDKDAIISAWQKIVKEATLFDYQLA